MSNIKLGLTNRQQAYIMLLAILLATWTPTLTAWMNNGMPTDRLALGMLFASLLGGFTASILVFIKESLGGVIPPQAVSTQKTLPPPP